MYILTNHGNTVLVFLRLITSTPRLSHQLWASSQRTFWLREKSLRCTVRREHVLSLHWRGRICHPKMTTRRQSKHSLHFPDGDIRFGKRVFWNSTSPTVATQRRALSKKNNRGLGSASIVLQMKSRCLIKVLLRVFQCFREWNKTVCCPSGLLGVDDWYLWSPGKDQRLEETQGKACVGLMETGNQWHGRSVQGKSQLSQQQKTLICSISPLPASPLGRCVAVSPRSHWPPSGKTCCLISLSLKVLICKTGNKSSWPCREG